MYIISNIFALFICIYKCVKHKILQVWFFNACAQASVSSSNVYVVFCTLRIPCMHVTQQISTYKSATAPVLHQSSLSLPQNALSAKVWAIGSAGACRSILNTWWFSLQWLILALLHQSFGECSYLDEISKALNTDWSQQYNSFDTQHTYSSLSTDYIGYGPQCSLKFSK